MISDKDAREIDCLEELLVLRGVSIDQLRRCYARFLLKLVNSGIFRDVSNDTMKIIDSCLNSAIARETIDKADCSTKKHISALWEIEERREAHNETGSRLARCVIMCFGTEKEWIESDSGDPTPLDYYLFLLARCAPDIPQQFIMFFRGLLDAKKG